MGYRDDMREGTRDAYWTIGKVLPLILLVIGLLTLLGWGLQSAGIIGANIDRQVVKHSRQYVESKQASLQNLYSEYAKLQTKVAEADAAGLTNVADAARAQQMALLNQMKREANNIPTSEIPADVARLVR